MIVGCAGAGKTTLLRKLHGGGITDEDEPTETTIGLEVHEDLFIIKENKLTDFANVDNSRNPYLDNNVISMTDFAGQVAYYACHQVYLSRRAFYIVVVDMSKKLDEESRMYDTDRHYPTGSLFHSWTYGDYFHFWLQTINTYCNDGITQKDPNHTTVIKDSRANVNFQPVILVATHKDKL
ncbi:probable serine/threonine-protein kinase roco5, partial [Saccostrea cucullata]